MQQLGDEVQGPKRVRVVGRADLGVVIQVGKNMGMGKTAMFCDVVYFPDTGEVGFYAQEKLTPVKG